MVDKEGQPVPLYYHPDYERHTQTPGHPECPDRVTAIMNKIKDEGIPVTVMDPVEVKEKEVLKVHLREHFERVRDFGVGFMDGDTFHNDLTFGYAMRAIGGTVGAVIQAAEEKRATFALPRPPGHHAGRDCNMGFCYFNNVAVAARVVQERDPSIDRIAIVDIDAHHGNGTNDIFYSDPNILYISTHQWGIFPGTGHESDVGRGEGEGRTVNLPLGHGMGDATFEMTWGDIIGPILREFGPKLIIVSMGVDSHFMDPLTGLSLSSSGFEFLVRSLHETAGELCGGSIAFALEGGYHLQALAETVAGAIKLAGGADHGLRYRYDTSNDDSPDTERVGSFLDVHSSYWRL